MVPADDGSTLGELGDPCDRRIDTLCGVGAESGDRAGFQDEVLF